MVLCPIARRPFILDMFKGIMNPADDAEVSAGFYINRQSINIGVNFYDVGHDGALGVTEARHSPLQATAKFGVFQKGSFQVIFRFQIVF